MVKLYKGGVYLVNGQQVVEDGPEAQEALRHLSGTALSKEEARKGTMAYGILEAHNTSGNMEKLRIRFDAIASHDITYVGIIQTARASGMEKFPLPYVLTNCHNSLCAVGGTINEDDHMFAISAAKKYGGIYVPPHLAVIHQYMREMMAGCGKMILGSDSHTRYGALGTMAVGEGGGELAKQLLERTYDLNCPQVVAVYLKNKPIPGVGPQDVALSIISAVFQNGYVKNKVMEFVGEGIQNLGVEYRNGIDVMTTETTCLTSIWRTDEGVKEYLKAHGRGEDYLPLAPQAIAYYEGMVEVDLAAIRPMIALPFHPSNAYTIAQVKENPREIFHLVEEGAKKSFENTKVSFDLQSKIHPDGIHLDQGVVAGCAGGTFDNLCAVADIMAGHTPGNGRFSMSVYPSSQPTYIGLVKNGTVEQFMTSGVLVRSAFCGPCFGAGDTPANGALSIRHTTRNFPNREGSKPSDGQLSSVALMDARSIAATARNGGVLTGADELDITYRNPPYAFHGQVYQNRLYQGYGKAQPETPLQFGPNITDWPAMVPLTENLLLKVVSFITDPVTTTDELIPSGETSSYRSNPLRLAEFTLSRKDPGYVARAKEVHKTELLREAGNNPMATCTRLADIYAKVERATGEHPDPYTVGLGSTIYAVKPGDGSAREQAASCQKVLGGWANIAQEYATKRYRSNLINWGVVPFLLEGEPTFENGDFIYIPHVRKAVMEGTPTKAYVVGETVREIALSTGELTPDEKAIILSGCLINFYRDEK